MSSGLLLVTNRNFAMLWLSQVLSQAGSKMYQIAAMWWLLSLEKEHSGFYLGAMMIVSVLPAILAVNQIGRIVDRVKPRRILLGADFAGIGLSLVVMLSFQTQTITMGLFLAAAFLYATFHGFIDPTLNKVLPLLVDRKQMEGAVAFVSSTQTLASFSGAILGAVLIDWVGIVGVVLIDCLTYVVSVICNLLIRYERATVSAETAGKASDNLTSWTILKPMPLLKILFFGFAMVNFFGTPLIMILPLYTKNVLGSSASMLGVLESCIWVGMLLGSFSSQHLGFKNHPIRFVFWCLVSFGASLLLPGLGLPVSAYGVCLVAAGGSLGLLNVRLLSYFQEIIADHLKGRFFALLQAIISFAIPLGFFLFGLLSDWLSVGSLCVLQGFGVLTVSLVFLFLASREGEFHSYRGVPSVVG